MYQFYEIASRLLESLTSLGEWFMSKPFASSSSSTFLGIQNFFGIINGGDWNTSIFHTFTDLTMLEILLGGGLVVVLVWRVWKFILDGIPLIG